MNTLYCIVLFGISTQLLVIAETQLISRFLNRILFSKRNSEEDSYPVYPRRRPSPYRRRRPPDHDPYKYDPDDDEHHRDHSISRPSQRPHPTYRKSKPQTKEQQQDSEDSSPPMTIYLQPGLNGDSGKPRRIRIVTVNNYAPFNNRPLGSGVGNAYQSTAFWDRSLIPKEMLFPQSDFQTPGATASQSTTTRYGPYSDQENIDTTGPRSTYDYYKKRKRK